MGDVPNLDAMSQRELDAFAHKYRYRYVKRKDAEALVGRRKGYTRIASLLGAYANNKSVAMQCRLRGDIAGATTYESICDNIYGRLPADLRW